MVATVLSEACHHNAQPPFQSQTVVEVETHAAPWREGAESVGVDRTHEKPRALRRQTTSSPKSDAEFFIGTDDDEDSAWTDKPPQSPSRPPSLLWCLLELASHCFVVVMGMDRQFGRTCR